MKTKTKCIFAIVAHFTVPSSIAIAETTKLICRNADNSSAGPLEIDKKSAIAYRFSNRDAWSITSITPEHITMIKFMEVGAQVAVLDTVTGTLEQAFIGHACDPSCDQGHTMKLKNLTIGAQRCRKTLIE